MLKHKTKAFISLLLSMLILICIVLLLVKASPSGHRCHGSECEVCQEIIKIENIRREKLFNIRLFPRIRQISFEYIDEKSVNFTSDFNMTLVDLKVIMIN